MDLRLATTINIKLGPFVDKADGFTPKTALTPTVKLSKNGGTMAARNSATATAHDADGYYTVELNSTDTGTLGRLRVMSTDTANILPVWENFTVISADYYDEKYRTATALTGASGTTATLDAGASATDNLYNGQVLVITGGTGVGQARRVIGYVGSTKVATVDLAWVTNPVSGSTFRLVSEASAFLSALERSAIADAYLDRTDAIETGLTPRNAHRLEVAALAGKLSGASTGAGTVVIRNAIADSKNRITAANDSNGNRTSVTVDLT